MMSIIRSVIEVDQAIIDRYNAAVQELEAVFDELLKIAKEQRK